MPFGRGSKRKKRKKKRLSINGTFADKNEEFKRKIATNP